MNCPQNSKAQADAILEDFLVGGERGGGGAGAEEATAPPPPELLDEMEHLEGADPPSSARAGARGP